MSVLRVTTFSGLGVGDWSFYPGSPQQQPDVPFFGTHESDRRVCAQVERRVAQVACRECNARHDLAAAPCQPGDEVVDFFSGK